MADETAVGGNAVENIMKRNLIVNVSHCYLKKDFQGKPQTREGPQTLQFARFEHIQSIFKSKRNKSDFNSLSSEQLDGLLSKFEFESLSFIYIYIYI